jgi:hypothetical protein
VHKHREHTTANVGQTPALPDRRPVGRASADALFVAGRATLYRLFDIGYEIDLAHASRLLSAAAPERTIPLRGEARAIVIPNPPLTVVLGAESLELPSGVVQASVSACLFDFGVASLRLAVAPPGPTEWAEFVAWGAALDTDRYSSVFERRLAELFDRVRPAVVRPAPSPVVEDYTVFRITGLVGGDGRSAGPGVLDDGDIAPLLLNERRPLADETRRALLPHRFSYTPQDIVVLSWDAALVIEPAVEDLDVELILEIANAQILELRVFDATLDGELRSMYDRIGTARRRARPLRGRRYRTLLAGLHALVADTTEVVERVDNALKVTNDVFLARVYTAALQLFRAAAWRSGIDRKLGIVRETYGMLNAEGQAARTEALETIIVLLIVIEIVLGLWGAL